MSIEALWGRLVADRTQVLARAEQFAALTLPRILTPEGEAGDDYAKVHDFQAIGAVAVNHVVNKLAVAMFSPSRPFFRVELDPDSRKELMSLAPNPDAGLKQLIAIEEQIAEVEREASTGLDRLGQRAVLYTALRHLVIVGNAVMHLGDDQIRLFGLKQFCVKRNIAGQVQTLVVRESIRFDELAEDVRAALPNRYNPETTVNHFTCLKREIIAGKAHFVQTTAVDGTELGAAKYNGRWLVDDCPWKVLVWDLADDANYASSLVEEYSGDLEALSVLSKSLVTGAVLAAEIRYMVNPTMGTSAEDFGRSKNGDAVPGMGGDISVISGGNPQALQIAKDIIETYERRVSRAFLMNSAMTRNAERVTAEEFRAGAMELETSFGGTYTALAANFQAPIAYWLLERAGSDIRGTKLKLVVLTGLDALSRNGELENFRLAVSDLAAFTNLPPLLLERLNFDDIAKFVWTQRGISPKKFLKTEDQLLQEQQQRAAQQASAAGQMAAAETAGTNQVNQG